MMLNVGRVFAKKKKMLRHSMQKNKITFSLLKVYYRIYFGLSHIYNIIKIWGRRKGFFYMDIRIKECRDIHLDERCFIICTGSSLTIADLELLKNEYTFGMNSLCLVFDQTDWRPTYFGIQDEKVFKVVKEPLEKSGLKDVFIPECMAKRHKIPAEWIRIPLYDKYHAYDTAFRQKYDAKFSKEADIIIYEGYTITYSLIQIAVYMGFKEIYLLGCDFKYQKDEKNHIVEHGINPDPNKSGEKVKRMKVAFETAKSFCDENGIKIYNATRGGCLEIFERVNLEDIQGIVRASTTNKSEW